MHTEYILPNIFLDTNVLLDQLQLRPGMQSAERILSLGKEKALRICFSTLSVANIAYIMRKMEPLEKTKQTFSDWIDNFVILSNKDSDVYEAVRSANPDFEDALQLSCAENGRCQAIVTNNKKHFTPYTDMPVYTPDEFLAKLSGAEPA